MDIPIDFSSLTMEPVYRREGIGSASYITLLVTCN